MKKSFLKWAGGKSQMLPDILPLLADGKRLVEPFAGSAVVSLNTTLPAIVADSNRDLISLFQFIASRRRGDTYFEPKYNCEEQYYRLRKKFNRAMVGSAEQSEIFLYMNRHGFNGLCRYNRSGEFNVPFGRYKNPGYPYEAVTTFIERAEHVLFSANDFEETFRLVKRGDVVFCDPPYVPLTKTSSFTAFDADGFGSAQQMALAMCAKMAATKGARVIITNHDTPATRKLYADANEIRKVRIRRSIAASSGARKTVGELIAIYD